MLRYLLVGLVLSSAVSFASTCSELPAMFIVQDRSGSMDDTPNGGNPSASDPSKWSIAQQEVPALAAQFANRLRFGVGMYPSEASSCGAGNVVSAISYVASDVEVAYANSDTTGSTPTASALNASRNYLLGLALTTPVYVLLITDGMPNCTTSPTSDTLSAARALKNAGIKVYVVGFGNAVTSGNNKALLDEVALEGGTNSSYSVTNRAELAQALALIAGNASNCCRDVCTDGATQCSGVGAKQTCRMDPVVGCTNWVKESCASMTACSGGACQACPNVCTSGAKRCTATGTETCVAGPTGCTSWSSSPACAYGELCSAGVCGSCRACTSGSSRCTATGVETCEVDYVTGCTSWHAGSCANGSTCQNGRCTSCNLTCTVGATRCSGQTVETCVSNASGCTSWQAGQTCGNFCSGGACGTCGTQCTQGAKRCNGRSVETCVQDVNHCPVWSGSQSCGTDTYCSAGLCAECPGSCTPGARRCSSTGVPEHCSPEASGCMSWTPLAACNVARSETCVNGVCTEPCQDVCLEGTGRCDGKLPRQCEKGPSGCTVWKDKTACDAAHVCAEGVCRGRCASDEFNSCPATLTCKSVGGERVCLAASGVDAGTVVADGGSAGGSADAGGTTPNESNRTGPGMGSASGASGCNVSPVTWPFATILVVARFLLRRRSRR
jgi:hypothetical protein